MYLIHQNARVPYGVKSGGGAESDCPGTAHSASYISIKVNFNVVTAATLLCNGGFQSKELGQKMLSRQERFLVGRG